MSETLASARLVWGRTSGTPSHVALQKALAAEGQLLRGSSNQNDRVGQRGHLSFSMSHFKADERRVMRLRGAPLEDASAIARQHDAVHLAAVGVDADPAEWHAADLGAKHHGVAAGLQAVPDVSAPATGDNLEGQVGLDPGLWTRGCRLCGCWQRSQQLSLVGVGAEVAAA